MFGTETYNLKPDMITVAKALSSAYLPISALMISQRVFDAMVIESEKIGIFGHGFTYGGHPVPAAVALETIKIYEETDILGHVRHVGAHFQGRLQQLGSHPLIGEARGIGLLGALEIVKDKATRESFDGALAIGANVAKRAEDYGIITRAMGDTVAFAPPLIIGENEINEIFDVIKTALDETFEEL